MFQKFVNIVKHFRYFQIELFLFIFVFSLAVEDVTVTLIAQDKLCLKLLNSTKICSNLSKLKADDDVNGILIHHKDEILVQVTTFSFYQSVIYTVPVIISSMFLSSWADRHKSSTKTLLCLTAFMAGLESIYILICAIYFDSNVNLMLVAFIFFPLVGGSQSLGMAAISYISVTSHATDRVKRFSILELTYILSHPLGVFVGGILIGSPNVDDFARRNRQLHNYHHVLLLATIGKFVAFFYAIVMKFKPRMESTEEPSIGYNSESETDPLLIEAKMKLVKPKIESSKFRKFVNNSTDLFAWGNIIQSFETCFRRRPNRAHIFIWLLFICMTIVTMTNRSAAVLMFQFVQKLYFWDAGQFSSLNSILYLSTHVFGLLIVIPILTKVFRMADSTLLILGIISLISQNFIRGTIIHAIAFCASYFFGSITSIIAVSVRTKLSKLCPPSEQNRIFGVLTMLETISPLIGISLYTAIFNQTISFYPGFVFQLSCFLLLIPFVLAVYIAIRTMTNDISIESDISNNNYNAVSVDKNNNKDYNEDYSVSNHSRTSSTSFFNLSSTSKQTIISAHEIDTNSKS